MKGNQATIMAVIAGISVLFIGMLVVISVANSTGAYTADFYVTEEANTSVITDDTSYVLANADGTLFDLDEANIVVANSTDTWTTTNYTAYTNGTVIFGVANMDLIDTMLFTYHYSESPDSYVTAYTTGASNFYATLTLLAVGILVVASMFILSYFGYGKKM